MSASRRFPNMVVSLTAVVAGLLVSCSEAPPPEETAAKVHVRLGTDRLHDSLPSVLVGRNVGLITNHSGTDRGGKSTIDILFERTDVKLVALFAPEHGIRGTQSGSVDNTTDSITGLPIFSLHGETYQPPTR